ncbi:DUF4376 domain-containing protein [Sphingomonas jaspsi]|uniref:DUF4376 domain-containing protein n=1 Tax=Sphingomonas jaspsi TaxID=392409 RepID=UPI0004BC2903|nr:DUF4376 domain-containing protein [Sphingomonas jaspsi]
MTRYLIEKDGERQNVTSLDGYDDWVLVDEVDWQTPVEVRRENRWREVKVLRAEREDAPIETSIGLVQADAASRERLRSLALLPEVELKTADNRIVTLPGAAVAGVNVMIAERLAAIHARAQQLREEIEASDDPEAIDIEAGW